MKAHCLLRYIIIFTLAVSVHLSSSAQVVYYNVGYSGNRMNLSGLNQVVENYNTTRTWLDKDMRKFGYLDGFMMNFGGGFASFLFDVEMSFRSQKRKASGTDLNGNLGKRSLKVKNNTFAITFGGTSASTNSAVGFGLRTEFGGLKMKSKIEYNNKDDVEWEEIGDDHLMLRMGPSLKIMLANSEGLFFNITTYYCWSLFEQNMYELDEELNNVNHRDPPESLNIRPGVFGISLGIGVFGAE